MNLGKKLSPQTSSLLLLIAGAATLCGGGMFVHGLLRERRLGEESLSWPSTEGTVMRCEYYPSTRRHSGTTEISYRYSVDASVYFSDQVTVANHIMRGEAKDFAQEHPAGSEISVYYNRSHPGTAVLIPGIDPENTVALYLFGGLLVFLTVSCIAYSFTVIRNLITTRTVRSHA